jgi:hypothetical protein
LYQTTKKALEDNDVVMVIAPFVLKVDRDNFFFYLESQIQEKLNIIGV